MLVEPVTTWLLVRISPVGLMIMPVPAAWPLPSMVSMLTIAGTTFAAIASTVVAPPLVDVPGVTWVIGDSGTECSVCDDCAAWRCVLTARARLQPIPAPAAAATTATRTTKAAIRFHNESEGTGAGVAVGGGAHAGACAGDGSDGGRRLPSLSPAFISGIWSDMYRPTSALPWDLRC